MRNILRRLPGLTSLAVAGTVLAFGCQGSGSLARLQEELAQINEKNDTILSRLDDIEGKIGKAPAPGKRGPRPGQPDPKATYKVAVGKAYAKGPATAKVTIVEWSDFQ